MPIVMKMLEQPRATYMIQMIPVHSTCQVQHSEVSFSGGIALFRMVEWKLSNLDNVYITHRIVGYILAAQETRVQILSVLVPHGDLIVDKIVELKAN